jgi:DNA-directed RNA polymerase omega subunit
MENLPEKIDSKFRFVLLAATRAEQMIRGARPKVQVPGKPTRIAQAEVRQGLVDWEYGLPPEPVPAEPEEAVAESPAEAEATAETAEEVV